MWLVCLSFASGCARRKAIDHYNKGVELVQQGRHNDAMSEFLEAIRLRPNFPEARNSLGYVLSQMHRYEDAIEQFELAAAEPKFKQRSLAFLNLGTVYSNVQRYKDAENAFKQSLDLEETAQAHYTMAQVLAAQGKLLAAMNSLEKSLGLERERVYAMESDPLFEALYGNSRFESLRTKYRR